MRTVNRVMLITIALVIATACGKEPAPFAAVTVCSETFTACVGAATANCIQSGETITVDYTFTGATSIQHATCEASASGVVVGCDVGSPRTAYLTDAGSNVDVLAFKPSNCRLGN